MPTTAEEPKREFTPFSARTTSVYEAVPADILRRHAGMFLAVARDGSGWFEGCVGETPDAVRELMEERHPGREFRVLAAGR